MNIVTKDCRFKGENLSWLHILEYIFVYHFCQQGGYNLQITFMYTDYTIYNKTLLYIQVRVTNTTKLNLNK